MSALVWVWLSVAIASFSPGLVTDASAQQANAPKAAYATIRRYEGVTDSKEAGRRVNEGFVPIIRKIRGLVAYYWVDAGNGVMVSTSVFDSQAAAQESDRAAADWVGKNIKPLLPNPPQIAAGNVVAVK